MARYEVKGPDGGTYEVTMPEGLSPEQMRSALDKHFADMGIKAQRIENTQPQPSQPQAPRSQFPDVDFTAPPTEVRRRGASVPPEQRKAFLDEWSKAYVDKERSRGGVGQAVGDVARNLARGTPVGSWLDEANAATSSGLHRLGLGGAPYDESLAYQRATDAAIDRESTRLGELPLVGDVTVGGAQKLAGGVLSAPFAPVARVMGGTTMLPRIVNTGVSGAGYGAVYGAGEGSGTVDRSVNALFGGTIGGTLGAAAPPVAAGVARLFSRAPQPQGALAPMNRRAVENVADDMVADRVGGFAPVNMRPEAMIADLGPNLQGHTGGIARIPGEGQTIVKDAVGGTINHGRRGGAADRIRADTDAVLGPPQDLVALERNVVRGANARAQPNYDQFYNSRLPVTQELVDIIQSVPEPVVNAARRLAAADRIDIARPEALPRLIEYIKRGLDDHIENLRRAGNNAESRTYTRLNNDLRREVDTILSPNDPTQSAWAQARRLAGSGQQFREGLEQGREAFQRGTHPDQMRADLAGMGGRPVQRVGFDIGARGAIRDVMGEASSTLGSTGDAAIRRQLGSDYARDKLTQIVGDQRAGQIIGRLEAEGLYEQTRQAAVGNSVTTAMQNQARRYGARPEMADQIPVSLWGDARAAARWVLNKMTAGYMDERKRAEARDAARILVAQGDTRDAFINALTSYVTRRDVSQRARLAAEDVLVAAIEGTRQPAVSSRAISEERTP